jgi:hypothetical protein
VPPTARRRAHATPLTPSENWRSPQTEAVKTGAGGPIAQHAVAVKKLRSSATKGERLRDAGPGRRSRAATAAVPPWPRLGPDRRTTRTLRQVDETATETAAVQGFLFRPVLDEVRGGLARGRTVGSPFERAPDLPGSCGAHLTDRSNCASRSGRGAIDLLLGDRRSLPLRRRATFSGRNREGGGGVGPLRAIDDGRQRGRVCDDGAVALRSDRVARPRSSGSASARARFLRAPPRRLEGSDA